VLLLLPPLLLPLLHACETLLCASGAKSSSLSRSSMHAQPASHWFQQMDACELTISLTAVTLNALYFS
jgi:hypothetical protein